ncbi:unnamed protein product [Urochloa humidicola]
MGSQRVLGFVCGCGLLEPAVPHHCVAKSESGCGGGRGTGIGEGFHRLAHQLVRKGGVRAFTIRSISAGAVRGITVLYKHQDEQDVRIISHIKWIRIS